MNYFVILEPGEAKLRCEKLVFPKSPIPERDETKSCSLKRFHIKLSHRSKINVLNPATGESVGEMPRLGKAETERAIDAADAALPSWRALTAQERADLLLKWHDLMLEHKHDLALLILADRIAGRKVTCIDHLVIICSQSAQISKGQHVHNLGCPFCL